MQYTINGQEFTPQQLAQWSGERVRSSYLLPWEQSFWQFVKDWLDSDKTHIEQLTSGSTGTPKHISISKKQMEASAKNTIAYFEIGQGQNLLLCLSTDFIGGKMMVVRALLSGANLITEPPAQTPLSDIVANETIDFAAMIPTQLFNLMGDEAGRTKLKRVKQLILGGAAVSPSLRQDISEWTATQIYSTYGMTETVSHIAVEVLNGACADGCYYVLRGIGIDQDERGCLLIDAPMLNDEPLITNDLVEMLTANSFRFLGRYDNLINSGGIKLSPEVLEQKIAHLLAVNYFIAGVADEKWGERLVLVLESEEVPENLEAHLSEVLERHEIPKLIKCLPQLFYTPNGKLSRGATLEALGLSK